MKFKFSLKNLKKLRQIQEDLAKTDYAKACRNRDTEINRMESCKESIRNAKQLAFEIRKKGGRTKAELTGIEEFIEGELIIIKRKKEIIKGLSKIANDKLNLLIEASREMKIVEKLEEREKEKFKDHVKKIELKQNDESVVTHRKREREDDVRV